MAQQDAVYFASFYEDEYQLTGASSIISDEPASVTDSVSNKRQVVLFGGQRWRLSFNIGPIIYTGANPEMPGPLAAHIARHGVHSPFNQKMPQYGDIDTGTIRTSAAASAGDSKFRTTSSNGKIGQYIKFANHNKVYQIYGKFDGQGYKEVFVVPNLKIDVPNNNTVSLEPNIRVFYDEGMPLGLNYAGGVATVAISLVEDI